MFRLPRMLACLIVAALAALTTGSAMAQSVAFFYGPRIPEELLTAYDLVVVEPGQGHTVRTVPGRAELVAYLSVGEVSDTSAERTLIQPSWVLGRNDIWRSSVMDVASIDFQRDLIERRFEALWLQGYRTFFLDTLDSYQIVAKEEPARERQRNALIAIIKRMRQRHPDLKLFLNRGFELIDALGGEVHGVVAESLFSTFNPETGRYEPTSEESRTWLLARLHEVQQKHKLPIIIIDYVSVGDRATARALAQKSVDLGFVPWVSDQSLMAFGVGIVEVVSRRVMLVTQSSPGKPAAEHPAIRYLSPALEHLGYIVEHHDLATGLPQPVLGSLAGIVSWLDGKLAPAGYGQLLRAQSAAGTRLVIFGTPGFAIPSDDAVRVAEQLIADGAADHPQLGVSVTDASSSSGAAVRSVTSGGAADQAGLRAGDVITELGDRPVVDADSLIVAVRDHEPGSSVPITYTRDGSTRTATARLATASTAG